VADLLSDNPDVMGALLAALCDPGRFTPRAPHEPMSGWQRRAVIEHAAPYILAAERERIRRGVLARELILQHPEDGDRVAVLTLDLEQIIGTERDSDHG
jgi:hypothetical protein